MKRLKTDLQANRQLESELRSQLSSLSSQDRSLRSELGQLRQENELLQNKWVSPGGSLFVLRNGFRGEHSCLCFRLHSAVQAKQKDKQTISQLEKRLKVEQEARALAEKQLAEERKRKKMEEATAARAVALAAATR